MISNMGAENEISIGGEVIQVEAFNPPGSVVVIGLGYVGLLSRRGPLRSASE